MQYVLPAWYFQLRTDKSINPFPSVSEVRRQYAALVDEDEAYCSPVARQFDLAWQGFQKGIISDGPGHDMWTRDEVPAEDEYRFLRRFFHSRWVLYVLLLRLLSFNDPFREIAAFWRTRGVRRVDSYKRVVPGPGPDRPAGPLVASAPFVTVVIPTLNRYDYLKDVLKDLEQQDYKNFEVLVVDQSEPIRKEFYEGWNLDLTASYQEEKALWLARNSAIRAARGRYLLLYDDDSRVAPDWIRQHLQCLDYFEADISSGVSLTTVGGEIPDHYRYFRWSNQLDTGNVMLKRHVFERAGLFDRQFEKQRMGDGEYGLRAYLAGFKNISNPHAKRIHLKVGSGGLREMGSWDAFRTKKLLAPRPIPSVLYLYRKYYGRRAAILALLRSLPQSMIPYRFKKNKPLLAVGALLSVLALPLVLFQVSRSWRLSGKKLAEGPMIESLPPKPAYSGKGEGVKREGGREQRTEKP